MSTASSVAATATSTACSNVYDTPIQGVGCAMVHKDSYVKMMGKCCKKADVINYYHGCGLFCLAMDQTVKELYECLYDAGAKYQDVFCGLNNETDSATATEQASIPASAEATVISTAGASKDDKDDDKDKKGDNKSKTSQSASNATNSDNAAPGSKPQSGLSTAGITIGALVLSAAVFGTLQI